jgi:hypothetical protein
MSKQLSLVLFFYIAGDSPTCIEVAVSHARAAAVRHLSPQKVMHAKAALAQALCGMAGVQFV